MNTINAFKEAINAILPHLLGRRLTYSIRYYHNRKKWPNLKDPKDMSEILISKILDKDFEKYSIYADKIAVRKYVESKGLSHTLLTHYHYWDKAEDMDIRDLPHKFVLKTNNGSGGHDIIVCNDINTFDLEGAKNRLSKALNKKYNFEYQYRKIAPKIICEELIETEDGCAPLDYKFTCIHGEPQDIMVGIGRSEDAVKISRRNIDWTPKYCTIKSSQASIEPAPPKHLSEMIDMARVLSKDFDFVRVDLYEYKDQVYFGELTFSPAGGILGTYTNEAIIEYGIIYRNGL